MKRSILVLAIFSIFTTTVTAVEIIPDDGYIRNVILGGDGCKNDEKGVSVDKNSFSINFDDFIVRSDS